MPTIPLTREQMQEAVDLVEQYKSYVYAADALGMSRDKLRRRYEKACLYGIRPSAKKEEIKPHIRQRLGRMHLIIPDCQVKPGVKTEHLEWVGNYIADKRPDVIVNIGDFADMESLSRYDKGTIKAEGKRLKKDLQSAKDGMDKLVKPFKDLAGYKPELHMTMGNHEERLARFANENPAFEDVIGVHMLRYQKWGWRVHPFLKPVTIDGVDYAHFFTSGEKGYAVTSARALLNRRHRSAIMGHNQKTDVAFQPVTHQWAIFCGICNLHDEAYLGPQGNYVRRQILVLHEVEEGRFDPMFVSLRYLEKCYS